MSLLRPLLILSALGLAGCHHAAREAPAAPPAAPAAIPAPVTATAPIAADLLNATLWTQASVEHDSLVAQTFASARQRLDKALADSSIEALPKGERAAGNAAKLPPAVVVDVDETVLDNSPYQVRLINVDLDYDQAMFDQWCNEAAAKPLVGAVEFARYAESRGVTMFYVTNRKIAAKQVTTENLRRAGFPLSDREPTVFMAGEPESCAATGRVKSCRRKFIAETHRVVMLIGDQLSDFVDLPDNTPANRAAAVAGYEPWFGDRWFILPNPMYGSWEDAVTGGLPKGSAREAKRTAKRAALEP